MTAQDVVVRPDRHEPPDWLHRWIIPPNPFYCLSACCMMVGCYLVAHELALQPGRLAGLLALVGVGQLYEALLIALGVWLVRRGGRTEDGWLLLVIESIFLTDAAHLNAEVASASAFVGLVLTGLLLAAAAIKIAIIIHFLRLRLEPSQIGFIAAGFVLVLGLPTAIATLFEPSGINAWVIYGCWWALGATVALHGFWPQPERRMRGRALTRSHRIAAYLSAMLYASAGLHIFAMGWVYAVEVEPAFTGPLLVALLPWVAHVGARLRWREATIAAWQAALPAIAIALSMPHSEALSAFLPAAVPVMVSPFRFVLLLAAVVYAGLAIDTRRGAAALASIACLTAALIGHSPAAIAGTGRLGLGMIAVWFAFICLAVGAWGSLKPMLRKPPDAAPPDRPESPLTQSPT